MRRVVSGMAVWCAIGAAYAQQAAIAPQKPVAPAIVRPYKPVVVPPARTSNSPRLAELVRAGTLYLTVQDAIALTLENNIDIEIARYNPVLAEWRVTRAEAGGALPGVPNNAAQAGQVAIGQGVAGSQQAAGVRIISAGSGGGGTNAQISQIGPVAQTLDPTVQEASTFSHTSSPQPNVVQSITPVLVDETRAHSATYQEGFLTGGSVTLRYTDNWLKENSPTDLLNPSSAPNLSLAFQQNLLRGFGVAVNGRQITVAKIGLGISELNFKAEVTGIITQVLNAYYSLAAAREDVKAKQTAAEVARDFLTNVQGRIRLGSAAPPEAITAESQAVTSGQALVDARANLRQQEVRLKNLLSRTGAGDPVLASARIMPMDAITIPPQDDVPPLDEMIKEALAKRPDLAATRESNRASEVSALGTRNGLLPNLQVFGAESQAGLAGDPHSFVVRGRTFAPDPYFAGGIGTALAQVFRRNFPTERIGAGVQSPVHNWQATADFAIDQLQMRQSDLTSQKSINQVQVDALNAAVALSQARARYDAAVENRKLQEELFEGEQRKYKLGASTPYNVIQQQRDLMTAQAAEVMAKVQYVMARIGLDQTLGRTLEASGVRIQADEKPR